ncbi:MAG TPA: hypothetical protein VJ911_04490 [Cryomorphaceae bacterium]|nr:hypothetical protein [Cryomorphaceae bacterium]
MQRSAIVFLFISVFTFSCGSQHEGKQIDLYNGISITLRANEEIEEITEADTDAYFEVLGERPYQAPLFRKVKSGSDVLYIGIPVGASVDEILGDSVSADQYENWRYSYKFYMQEGEAVSEIAAHGDGNTVLMVASGNESQQFNTKFSADSLLSRLQNQ